MSLYLKICSIVIALILVFFVFRSLKKGKVSDRQALLWFLGALIIIILSVFPAILKLIADFLNIWWAPAVLIFAVLILFGFIIFNHTKYISDHYSQISELAMQVALLKDKLKNCEMELEELKSGMNSSSQEKSREE